MAGQQRSISTSYIHVFFVKGRCNTWMMFFGSSNCVPSSLLDNI